MSKKLTHEELEKEVIVQRKTEKSPLGREEWLLELIESIPDSLYIKNRKCES